MVPVTLDALAEELLGRGFARKTIAVYLIALRQATRSIDLDTVTAGELAAYAETLPHTRSSRALLRSALVAYWSATGRQGPAKAVRVPKKPRMRCRALDEATAAALAAAALRRRDRKGLAVLLGLYAGLRRTEIAGLRWSQVTDDGWLTVVGKGTATRSIPLHPAVVDAMAAVRVDSLSPGGRQGRDRIFPGAGGGPLNPTTVWTWARLVAAEAGLPPVATHVLRHTALATALDATGDLRAVQELAGHARPETTAGYTRVRRDRLVAAVSAISYDRVP